MIKYVVAVILSFTMISAISAQEEINDYSFVVVPDMYDFQFEKDQYQLNSLTKFLFNKHGFHAYFNTELPDVSRCDGLWADVVRDAGFIWTKITVILKDCNGREVYRSSEGRSKIKEYRKAYQQGIRLAFESIGELGIKQSEINEFSKMKKETPANSSVDAKAAVEIEETAKSPEVTQVVEVIDVKDMAVEDTMYESNGTFFILKNTDDGFKLYEKKEEALTQKGSLFVKKDEEMIFKDTAGNEFKSYFDTDKNLIIETSFQQLVFLLQR